MRKNIEIINSRYDEHHITTFHHCSFVLGVRDAEVRVGELGDTDEIDVERWNISNVGECEDSAATVDMCSAFDLTCRCAVRSVDGERLFESACVCK